MIKKAWITPFTTTLSVLSLESEFAEPEYKRLKIDEAAFPEVPTERHPLKHVVKVSLLDMEDLLLLRDTLNRYISEMSAFQ